MKNGKSYTFILQEDQESRLIFLGSAEDEFGMNWIEGSKPWGTIICPDGIKTAVKREILPNGHLQERFCFENVSEFPVFFKKTDVGIYATFHDDYRQADECMIRRCHTHIFCGGEASYVMALRMGGQAPHLGLMVTAGSISSYSTERDEGALSNDRGDFILHPVIEPLKPGGSAEIVWELFWFEDKGDFERQLIGGGKIPVLKTQQCTYFPGENIVFDVFYGAHVESADISVSFNERCVAFQSDWDGAVTRIHCGQKADNEGEIRVCVRVGVKELNAVFYVSPDLRNLVRSRCRFIAEKQQYHGEISMLDGAYLIYDNEEKTRYYSHLDDHNGGRERIGMGALLALWLQKEEDPCLRESLTQYVTYVYRELYDEETGTVYNDISHNLDWHRKYNYPWTAVLQIEMYHLTKETRYLEHAFRTMKRYYLEGGDRFYAIGLPVSELAALLRENHMDMQCEDLKTSFFRHADYILERGTSYPLHEVNFEQSIVAPGTSCLLQAYQISGEERYLEEAKRQLKLLDQFNGQQPDYHQFENSIRHWDGYWFGKYRMFGDTYPHYWSVLTGVDFIQYEQATGDHSFREMARASLRGCLNLFSADGSASCAMVFPQTVNGKKGNFYDPWANDQDWALYYALKYEDVILEGGL